MTNQFHGNDLLTDEDKEVMAGAFAEDFAAVIARYVPAGKRAAASLELSRKAAARLVDFYNTMQSPVPDGLEEWLHSQGIRPGGIRLTGSVIHVPAARWRAGLTN